MSAPAVIGAMVNPSPCPRCRTGRVQWRVSIDTDTYEGNCLQCGCEIPTTIATKSKSRTVTMIEQIRPADWREAVRTQIAALVAEITTVDGKRAEAERLIAALRAYGETDVPELPWDKRTNGAKKQPKRCTVCGQEKSYSNGKYFAGRWVCTPCQRKGATAVAS